MFFMIMLFSLPFLVVNRMVDQRGEDVGEDLEDADEEDAHEHPFADLLGQRRLHHPAETEADDGYDDCDHDGRPDHEAFAEGAFVYHKCTGYIVKTVCRFSNFMYLCRSDNS